VLSVLACGLLPGPTQRTSVTGSLSEKTANNGISPPGRIKDKNTTGHGNSYLARVLGNAAVAARRPDTFLGERYQRIARRRGRKKAVVAIGRSPLFIIWHLLADPGVRYTDLGSA
jgi:transposase